MVLIGHSQGGLLAKLLVIDSGSRSGTRSATSRPRRRASRRKPPSWSEGRVREADAGCAARDFIASRSTAALSRGRRRSGSRASCDAAARWEQGARRNGQGQRQGCALCCVGGRILQRVVDHTNNPALKALATIPVAPSVATGGGGGGGGGSDEGVVSYRSAHIDVAQSELVVRSGIGGSTCTWQTRRAPSAAPFGGKSPEWLNPPAILDRIHAMVVSRVGTSGR